MRLIKPIEQYSKRLTLEEIDILDKIGINFRNNRNYFYSRYNGINNLINSHKFFDTKKQIVSNEKVNKKIRNRLNKWYCDYLNEKIELECNKLEINYIDINPAYTSQICSNCGNFGERNGEIFICKNCGKKHADINASINILKRKDTKEINLYTKKEKVKEIIMKGEVS